LALFFKGYNPIKIFDKGHKKQPVSLGKEALKKKALKKNP